MAVGSGRDLKGEGVVVEDSYSIFTFESLQIHQRGVSRMFKKCLDRNFSDEIYSYFMDPPGEQKRASPVRLPLFKACKVILAHFEEKYPVPGCLVDFAEKRTQHS